MRAGAARFLGLLGLALVPAGLLGDVAWAVPPRALVDAQPFVLAGAGACLVAAWVLFEPPGRRRAAVAVAALAAAAVVGEVVLRWTVGPYHAGQYRLHDEWLYEYVPGTRRVNVKRDGGSTEDVPFEINESGFRGPPLRPAGSAKRVVVYGDSFVAAASTLQEETFVARLGEELRAGLGADVEAVNAGVTGYGPDQALLRMEHELPRLRPDLAVVVLLGENDYGDVLRNRFFELDARGAVRRGRPEVGVEMRREFDRAATDPVAVKLFRRAREGLHRAVHGPTLLESDERAEIFLATCRLQYRLTVEQGVRYITSPFLDPTDEDVRLEPASESARYKVRLLAAVVERIRDTARAHRVPLVLVVVPAAFDVCDDYDVDPADPRRFPAYRRQNLTEPMRDAAASLGVPHLDLFVPFRAAGAESLYFRGGDTHWNAAGQALAARLVARFVEARELIE